MLAVVVAVARNQVIGKGGDLPWRLPADLQGFKRITMGGCLIMGRRTWESIGRPLPGRRSLVVTRTPDYATGFDEVPTAASLDEAIDAANACSNGAEAFVIGGAALYAEALSKADRLYLTRVDAEVEGDVFFPDVDFADWVLCESESRGPDERNPYGLEFQVYNRSTA
ncbi:MAG: dihydrofolate reductase [Planctomycetales bacterium]|nr:dihydrofolate reductase [Planctomycetales bacterium]